jgi:hypothetical protein
VRAGRGPTGDRIRCAKDTGLRRLPSRESAIDQAWCVAVAIAADLIAWLQLHALDGDPTTAEPKRLRYRPMHTAARLVHGQRRRWLRIPATWPWATQLAAAFTRIPAPGSPLSAPTTDRRPRRPRPPPRQTADHHAQPPKRSTPLDQSGWPGGTAAAARESSRLAVCAVPSARMSFVFVGYQRMFRR